MKFEKQVEFARSAYFGTVSFLENDFQSFELKDKNIGEFTLKRHPEGNVSVWFLRSDGGCTGRYEIGSDVRETARKWLLSVINTIGYPNSKEFRDLVESELNTDPNDFCLTMSD